MPVYVDELRDYSDVDNYATRRFGKRWCHMVADTDEELHALALKIGMRRAWHQSAEQHLLSHYDLVPSRRAAALKAGAIDSPEDVRRLTAAAVEERRRSRRATVMEVKRP